jgi:hypothetical protein
LTCQTTGASTPWSLHGGSGNLIGADGGNSPIAGSRRLVSVTPRHALPRPGLAEPPVQEGALGPLDNFLPQHVTLPVLDAANAYARPDEVDATQEVRGAAEVADAAIALANAVHAGTTPWDDETPDRDVRQKLKKVMNWD